MEIYIEREKIILDDIREKLKWFTVDLIVAELVRTISNYRHKQKSIVSNVTFLAMNDFLVVIYLYSVCSVHSVHSLQIFSILLIL